MRVDFFLNFADVSSVVLFLLLCYYLCLLRMCNDNATVNARMSLGCPVCLAHRQHHCAVSCVSTQFEEIKMIMTILAIIVLLESACLQSPSIQTSTQVAFVQLCFFPRNCLRSLY